MAYFDFLPSQQAKISEEIRPIESTHTQAVRVDQIEKRIKASENQARFSQLWDRLPFNEVGTIRSERINVRIYPYGFSGEKTIALIQYQIVPSQVMGDQEFVHAREWHLIGRIENRKKSIVFFLDDHVQSLPIGYLALIEARLKQCGLINRDNLKESNCKDSHPFLDIRLMKLLRVSVKAGSDPSKPFTVCRDDRDPDTCVKMRPIETVAYRRDSNRSKQVIKTANKRIEYLEKKNEELERTIDRVKSPDVNIDPTSGKVIDTWFKVDRDKALNLVSHSKRKKR